MGVVSETTTDQQARAANGELTFDDRLARAQLIALNRQGRISNAVPPVNSVILAILLWGEVPTPVLAAWVALVWLTSLVRLVLYRRYDSATAQGRGHELVWRRIWVVAYTTSGLIWGVGSVVLFPMDSFVNQAFLVIFVLGMGAGGAASFAPYIPALIGYVVPLTVPIATMLVFQGTPPHMILGVSGFIFMLALVFLGRAGNRSFAESFRLGVENQLLASDLSNARDRLEGALDSMSEAFALFDADGRLVESNDKFEELLGAGGPPLDELDYDGFLLALARGGRIRGAGLDPSAWRDEILQKRQRGEFPIEIAFVDGRWLMLSDAPTGDRGTVTTLADITQVKRHETQLAESEQRFRDFTTAASDWAWELDAEGRFSDVSGRYSEVSGRSPEFLIGTRLLDLPSTDYREDWNRLVASMDARQPFRNVRAVRPRADRGVFHFLLNGVPIFSPSGAFLGYRGTGTDITAMVRAEERARQAQSRLFEAIESIPASFVLFDELGRLSLWNSRAPEYFPGASSLIVAGTTFEQLMCACAESGTVIDARDRPDAWVQEQLDWFANPAQRHEMRFIDGRYVQLLGRRTADGGSVCVATDVTGIRRGQEELAEKTAMLQATLEGMGEGLVVLDGDRRAVLANDRLERLAVLGDRRSIIGRSFRRILDAVATGIEPIEAGNGPVADGPGWLDERLEQGIPFQFEVRRPGRQVMLVRADPLAGGGWVCVFTDVTAERRAQDALEESEDRYRRLVEASPDTIVVYARGRFVFVNAAGVRMLGVRSPDELVGRRVLDFVHPDDHEIARVSEPMRGVQDEMEIHEFRVRRTDGSMFEAEASGIEFSFRGEPATLAIVRDITERKLAQAQLIQTSKLALLGEMAASMAHELNQPLNIIRMASDSSLILMEEGKTDVDSHREEFERISNQSQRMANIINHMRVFSRQDDSGEAPFDPVTSVNAAASMVREQYRLDGVSVETVLPKRTSLVRGQPIRLEQVILNLLSNARDAVIARSRLADPPANMVIEVSAFVDSGSHEPGTRARPEEVIITITDNGGGIPEDVIGHVFEPFYTTKTPGEGTGLGLAIGYSIVAGMGGSISVANGLRGAVFEVRLPVARDAEEAGPDAAVTSGRESGD